MISQTLFPIAFVGVMFLMNSYIYRRFVKRLHFDIRRVALITLTLLTLLELLFVIQMLFHPFLESPELFYILSVSVGITVMLFFITLLFDLVQTASQRIPLDTGRRKFMKIIFDVTMLVLAFSYLLKGVMGGVKRPELNFIDVHIKDLGFEELKVVQLSDVHVGHTIDKAFVQECVERINALKADIVVITGDLVDRKIAFVKEDLAPLQELQSRFGTYFVLGNHEYYHGAQDIADHLATIGVKPLLNESVTVGDADHSINIVGLNDIQSIRFKTMLIDVDKAFKDLNHDHPTLLLSHQPKSLEFVQDQPFDLMLSGHTHGGQIFPFGFLVMLQQPYLYGLHAVTTAKQIFVSRGTGYWGPPVRVLAPSEISVLILKNS